MLDHNKKRNLFILPDKNSTYHTIRKFMNFLGEEKTILYLDFSFFKNKEIGDHYMTYRSISYEMAQSPKDFREFLITNLRNVELLIIDINGVHNMYLLKEIDSIIQGLNLSIFCLEKRANHILNFDYRFDEIYFVTDKIRVASDDSEFDFESFKLQFIRNIKLNKLI
jgi:hypothetical protein